jgi:hypothetical protein
MEIKKLKDFIFESNNDPYGEEDCNEEETRKIKIQEVVDKYEEKWSSSAQGKAQEFIENYPYKQDFNEAEMDEVDDVDLDDDEVEEDGWSPEIEVYVLSQMGMYVGDKPTDNISTDDWCDFFNDLVEAGW